MNILVLNGSPKGQYSITLQMVKYLEKHCPDPKSQGQYDFPQKKFGTMLKM